MFVILLNVVAFSPSLVNASARTVPLPLTPIDLAHSLVSVTWVLVFLAQVTLVAAGRPAVHRRLGVFGVLLSAAFIVVTWFMLVEGARRGFDLSSTLVPRGTSVDPGTFLAPAGTLIPLGNVLTGGMVILCLPAIRDWVWERRIHPVSLWGAIVIVLWSTVFLIVLPQTAVWRNFAAWVVQ